MRHHAAATIAFIIRCPPSGKRLRSQLWWRGL